MDRLARNIDDFRRIVRDLTAKGVRVQFIKEQLTFTGDDTAMATLPLSVMGAFAEFVSAEFTNAAGKSSRPADLLGNLHAVLIAQACNFGFTARADASGISYDTLAWTAEWPPGGHPSRCYRHAGQLLLSPPHVERVGRGALSSSGGQRFPTKGKSISARALSRYFRGRGDLHLHPRLRPALDLWDRDSEAVSRHPRGRRP